MTVNNFTICVLCYGNHAPIAERCIGSLVGDWGIPAPHLRIGLNSVCTATRDLAYRAAPTGVVEYTENMCKYPVMREMVHGLGRITTPYLMWFDDDSYITQPLDPWLTNVESAMANADMIGDPFTVAWQGKQRDFVRSRSWYTGKDPDQRKRINFMVGGWWTIRTEILYKYDYPFRELTHNGGDVMLGELCYQQGLRMASFRHGVKINADNAGVPHKAERRGCSQRPLGYDYDAGIDKTLNIATSPNQVMR